TPGVTGLVGSHGAGSEPAALMPEEDASVLRSMGMSTRHNDVEFDVGEPVTFIDGAFTGMHGKVTAGDKEKWRLKDVT
ncbi:transcription termination/antitermination protein NusG, partial [Lactobacillus paracasei]|uniref:transcription termination/antitermination protein NusG n=1 Tax=Lacticaseibacillus paracasei TaxID=1597 RepID=UPI0013C98F4B|nr:transcription termination/antitermination protein NusG [Lacticaseibacillus paracasei]